MNDAACMVTQETDSPGNDKNDSDDIQNASHTGDVLRFENKAIYTFLVYNYETRDILPLNTHNSDEVGGFLWNL